MVRFRIADWKDMDDGQKDGALDISRTLHNKPGIVNGLGWDLDNGVTHGLCLLDNDKPAAFLTADFRTSAQLLIVRSVVQTSAKSFYKITGRMPMEELAIRMAHAAIPLGCKKWHASQSSKESQNALSRLSRYGWINEDDHTINAEKLPNPLDLERLQNERLQRGAEIDSLSTGVGKVRPPRTRKDSLGNK